MTTLLLLGIGLQLLNPQILRRFIDLAQSGAPLQALLEAGLLFLGIAAAIQAVQVVETYLATSVGLQATNRLRADLMLHCLRLDLSFHNARTPGELIERVDGDVATLSNFFSRFVVNLVGNALLLLGVLVLLFQIEPRVGTALTLFALVTLAVVVRLRGVATPYFTRVRAASAGLFGLIEERLAGTEDIRANGGVAYTMRRLLERTRALVYAQVKASVVGSGTWSLSLLLFSVGTALALGLGTYLFQAGVMTIGTVYLIFRYTELIQQPIEGINRQLQDLQQAAAGLKRIQELFATHTVLVDGAGTLPKGPLSVEFQDVEFGYADRREGENGRQPAAGGKQQAESDEPVLNGRPPSVLHEVSFALEPGTTLGLLGRTGSGKTTLTRLLFRLYDPTAGEIRLGGRELGSLLLADLRRHVGMVTQEIQLFHASVRDNLAFFDPAIPDERILAALHELGLWEWYESLPDGLDTKLAGGGGLSAGEAQLLAFVRVFLKDPGLIILDEASSRLDPATEQRLTQAMTRLLEGRTAIIIAHRLPTVQRADQIMILEAGRIREFGPREALVSDPASRFAQLLRAGMEEALA
ncbi:MAG: ABC transporter ATP-binding protein [Anaerolineae bacterium]|nr:ABC transporter ATP-binding protein [Anaerolineae bacterium]